MKPKVYIILLNFNSWRDPVDCLESIRKNGYDNYQVVIVDNCSTNDSVERILESLKRRKLDVICYERADSENDSLLKTREKKSRKTGRNQPVILIHSEVNNGFSAGNNIGMKYGLASGDSEYFWILNSDTLIFRDTLGLMVELAQKDPSSGIIGSKLLFYNEPERIQTLGNDNVGWKGIGNGSYDGMPDSERLNGVLEMKSIIGASMLVKRTLIDDIGMMDEDYFMYHEESDWCARAIKAGYRLLVECRSRILHKEGGSTGRVRTVKSFMGRRVSRTTISDFLIWGYYSLRNEIYFVKKNHRSKYPLYCLAVLPKKFFIKTASIFLFNDDRKASRLYLMCRGLIDGIFGRMGKTIDPAEWRRRFS